MKVWLRDALGLRKRESPFPWQEELLRRFQRGEIPPALDMPTGLGKTSVMAIWLVARASGARVPRRLVYVVDRRAVVDQATTEAERLREWVDQHADVKEALQLTRSIPISTLRGQHIDNREWLRDPAVPAIIVGTVDMIGSRLLFEGYGVSRRMRPYHAGLLGSDTLIVIDEAHLVPPFERLIEAIEAGTAEGGYFAPREKVRCEIVPQFRLLSLSATGRERPGALRLQPPDCAHPIVRKRLTARKRLVLRAAVPTKELAKVLADEARAIMTSGAPSRCIVFANSREIAQEVKNLLATGEADAELFVGARRGHERAAAARWLRERGFLAGSNTGPAKATYLIATSAGEVGIDLDADDLVADLVAWERLVQRFGRVNRRGEGDARVVIVPEQRENTDDAGHAESVRALLAALPELGDGTRDASPQAIMALKDRADLVQLVEKATTLSPLHPPLNRALIESWSMTSLEEHTGRPEVAPWIRGWIDADQPQTTIVIREHLPIDASGALLSDPDVDTYFDVAPPHLSEKLETETWRALEWLMSRQRQIQGRQRAAPDDEPGENGEEASAQRLRWLDGNPIVGVIFDCVRSARVREVRLADLASKEGRKSLQSDLSGATLIVDLRIGGLSGGLLDEQASEATAVPADDGRSGGVPFRFRVEADAIGGSADSAVVEGSSWREEARIVLDSNEERPRLWLVIETLPGAGAESEEGRSVAPSRAQILDEHQGWAALQARKLAGRLDVPEPFAEVLVLAASLHDEGKRSPCWQRAFGVSERDLKAGKVYGKTTRRPNFAVLSRYRHELGSIPRAEADPRVNELAPDLRDLCLHLIASHHGFARPILRTDGAEGPPSALEERARDLALRFARLEKTWGPWGLAWWEALLRAADQLASRDNDEVVLRG